MTSSNALIRTAILGASGYTGAELIRLLLNHPNIRIEALSAESQAGKPVAEAYPQLRPYNLPDLVTIQEIDFTKIDLVFCALPHGTTQAVVAALPESVKVIDISADFRLESLEAYAEWYGHPHKAPGLQNGAVYGLTEHARDKVKNARLIACPGCYPTSSLLPLIPLLKSGLIETSSIIIDAKSGVTGAGRAAKQANLFCEIDGGMSAYSVGKHRHMPEIEQELSRAAATPVTISFTPHLIPMSRGILSTIYMRLAPKQSVADLRKALTVAYANEPFVHVLPEGVAPSTHAVRGTNHCMMNVFADRTAGQAIVVSVIDNLVKGASGQAVQNMNVMYGWPETLGLEAAALFP